MSKRQKRFQVLAERPVNKDGFIKEWVEVGLVGEPLPKGTVGAVSHRPQGVQVCR